jgi:2-phosphoglycolate phosphatase
MKLKALLLDLDGTLVDTAPDMVGTLNRLLRNHGQAAADQSAASKLVSNGARALIEFGFARPLEEAHTLDLIAQFLSDYAEHVADQSELYAGMSDVLDLCAENNIVWGVITNKPLELSRALLEGLGLFDRCSILLGGDSLPVKKPDPAPMLHSCMVLNLAPSECLYVGDHERDILAGKNAGMDTAAALWGYINEDQNPAGWGASYIVNEPGGLMQLVQEKIASKS